MPHLWSQRAITDQMPLFNNINIITQTLIPKAVNFLHSLKCGYPQRWGPWGGVRDG